MTFKAIVFCIVSLVVSFATTQAQTLPVDESGKISFLEVVVTDSMPKEKLFNNGVRWLKSLSNPEEKFTLSAIDSSNQKVNGLFEFQVFQQTGMLRKMTGAISCKLSIETKDNKYRYAFSDFVYHYYTQNRNYKMEKTGKTKLLEEPEAAGWQKLWEKHKQTTFAKVTAMTTAMNTELKKKDNAPKEKKVKKVEW